MSAYPDWQPAPNIGGDPNLYEVENAAVDPDRTVWGELRRLAPWNGRHLVDLGCGTGFWLPRYAEDAGRVTGVEPDPALLARTAARLAAAGSGGAGGGGAAGGAVRAVAGSAEHLPLPDASVDVVHARFAYFYGPGAEAGLAEVLRVLRPGGSLVVIDNDRGAGEFADLLAASTVGNATFDPAATERWWAARGADRFPVMSAWRFTRRRDLEAVLRLEFPAEVAGRWLADHPDALGLTYGVVLYRVRR